MVVKLNSRLKSNEEEEEGFGFGIRATADNTRTVFCPGLFASSQFALINSIRFYLTDFIYQLVLESQSEGVWAVGAAPLACDGHSLCIWISPESQGQDLALTVLYMLYSFDSGGRGA